MLKSGQRSSAGMQQQQRPDTSNSAFFQELSSTGTSSSSLLVQQRENGDEFSGQHQQQQSAVIYSSPLARSYVTTGDQTGSIIEDNSGERCVDTGKDDSEMDYNISYSSMLSGSGSQQQSLSASLSGDQFDATQLLDQLPVNHTTLVFSRSRNSSIHSSPTKTLHRRQLSKQQLSNYYYEDQILQANQNSDKLQNELADRDTQVRKLKRQLSRLKQRYSDLEHENRKLISGQSGDKAAVESCGVDSLSLKERASKHDENMARETLSQVSQLKQSSQNSSEIHDTQPQLSQSSNSCGKHSFNSANELVPLIKFLQTQNQQYQAEIARLEAELGLHTKENADLSGKLQDMKTQYEQCSSEWVAEMQELRAALQQTSLDNSSMVQAMSKQRDELNERIEELDNRCQELTSENESFQFLLQSKTLKGELDFSEPNRVIASPTDTVRSMSEEFPLGCDKESSAHSVEESAVQNSLHKRISLLEEENRSLLVYMRKILSKIMESNSDVVKKVLEQG